MKSLRVGKKFEQGIWSFSAKWEEIRVALLDLVDFLFYGGPSNLHGNLVGLFDHPEDPRLPGFHHSRPGRRVLGRLSVPWRIKVMSAVAQIVARPDKFKSMALHGFGKSYFLGMAGLGAGSIRRLRGLTQVASEDPLMMLFCIAADHEADLLVKRSERWPAGLKSRLSAAAWVSLARNS